METDTSNDDWHFPESFQELVTSLHQRFSKIDFPHKEIHEYEHQELTTALKQSVSLRQLALEDNNLGTLGAEAVANALVVQTRLTELYIEANDIWDEGTSSLAHALKQNTSVIALYLRYNRIGSPGACSLGEMLRHNTTLTTLSLRGNSIEAEGAKGLFTALKSNQTLSTLSLRDNSIGVEGAKHVADCLKTNRSLVEIFLETNSIMDEGAVQILNGLEHNKTLTFMDLLDNQVSAGILKRVKKKLEYQKSLQKAAYLQAKQSRSKVAWKRSKLMVIGEGAVGKTATIRSLLSRPFNPEWDSTVGVSLTEAVARRKGTEAEADDRGSMWLVSRKKEFASSFLHREGAKLYNSLTHNRHAPVTMKRESREKQKPQPESSSKDGSESVKAVQNKAPSATIANTRRKKNAKGFEKERFNKAALEVGSLKISIWDYGGQAVFYTLHHIFLTKWGVYLLVFNPKGYLADPNCTENYLRFWLHSVRTHAPEAPIIMVATFSSEVDRRKWNKLNKMIAKLVKRSSSYRSLVPNNGLSYFPIDNKTRVGVDALRQAAEEAVSKQDVVNFPVSLQWMQALDASLDKKSPWIRLEQYKEIAEAVGVSSSEEINAMLALFHELGVILHFTSTESLREFVVTSPDWLIENVSKLIRDSSLHKLDTDKLVSAGLRTDLETLHTKGLVSRDLLEFFWGRTEASFLLDLMRSLFLLSNWKFRTEEELYLVPSMIQGNIENTNTQGTDFSCAVCEIRFEYLLPGVLERLVCLCVEYSSTRIDSPEPMLSKRFCRVWLNNSYFVDLSPTVETIRVIISDKAQAVECMNVLKSMLRKVNLDIMGSGLIYDVFMQEGSKMVPYRKAKRGLAASSPSDNKQKMTSVEFDSFLQSF